LDTLLIGELVGARGVSKKGGGEVVPGGVLEGCKGWWEVGNRSKD